MYQKGKWSNETILTVWKKGNTEGNNDPDVFRKDVCGAWMKFDQHGDRDAKYGWEVDHIKPEAHDGTDELSNLQPLHWKNNVEKGDSLQLKCAIKS